MKWINRIWKASIFVVVLVLCLSFLSANEAKARIDFFGWQSGELSLGVWFLTFFCAGAILGWLLTVPPILLLKRQVRKLSSLGQKDGVTKVEAGSVVETESTQDKVV